MKVEILHSGFGLPSKWKEYDYPGDTIEEAAYNAVRSIRSDLTDENHTHKTGPKTITWGGKEDTFTSVTILKNENSPGFCLAPAWVDDGPGAFWFGMQYRIPQKEN